MDEPVFLLPYYATHFGHYTGEILGLLPLYAKLIKEMSLVGKRKLVYIEGDEDSQLMLSSFHLDDCCLKISPQMALDHTLIFPDAILLPLMHPWQNISFLKNSLSTHFPYIPTSTKKVFLTSYRTERITNLEELLEYFKLNNFEVVDARNCDALTIKNCTDVLICEDGSISHMPLILEMKSILFGDLTTLNLNIVKPIMNIQRRITLAALFLQSFMRAYVFMSHVEW